MPLVTTCLLLALPVQTSIERTYVQSVAREELLRVDGGIVSNGETLHNSGTIQLTVDGVVAGEAEMLRSVVDGSIETSYEVSFTGISPTSYEFDFLAGIAACDIFCNWGTSDYYEESDYGYNEPLAGGETAALSKSVPGYSLMSITNPSAFSWQFASSGFTYVHQLNVGASWSAADPVLLNTFELFVRTSMSTESTFKLFQAAAITYCTSQANTTGQTAKLEVFGSPESGSERFAVQVTDVAPGSGGILFMADSFGSTVGNTATLCLSGGVSRVGGIQFAPDGELVFDVDLTGWPSGQTAYFQSYFRDPQFAVSASEAVAITIR